MNLGRLENETDLTGPKYDPWTKDCGSLARNRPWLFGENSWPSRNSQSSRGFAQQKNYRTGKPHMLAVSLENQVWNRSTKQTKNKPSADTNGMAILCHRLFPESFVKCMTGHPITPMLQSLLTTWPVQSVWSTGGATGFSPDRSVSMKRAKTPRCTKLMFSDSSASPFGQECPSPHSGRWDGYLLTVQVEHLHVAEVRKLLHLTANKMWPRTVEAQAEELKDSSGMVYHLYVQKKRCKPIRCKPENEC